MSDMPRPRRTHAQARAEMREGILRLGREQLDTRGAAALSVREIARGLGVASSAVYRHVRSRDDLLTLLVVDAFTDLADAVEDAVGHTVTPDDRVGGTPASDLRSVSHAVRRWAVDNPARWALIYGSPVPGYAAPPDDTVTPGTRVMSVFLGILAQGTPPPAAEPPSPELARELDTGAHELRIPASPLLMAEAVAAWTSLVGTISAEIFGQLGPGFSDLGGELLDRWTADTARRFGL